MDKIVVGGVPGYDGEYEFDLARPFNAREWRWIRKISEHTPRTIGDGYTNSDPDLFVAFAVIAMCRDEKITRDDWQKTAADLAEVPLDGTTLRLVVEPEEDDFPLALTSTHSEAST